MSQKELRAGSVVRSCVSVKFFETGILKQMNNNFQMNVIDAPLVCPPGQQLDHTGYCREAWRSTFKFSNLLNLNIS